MNFKSVESKIKDRGLNVRATAQELLSAWGYDLSSRKPGIAYMDEDGNPVTTLDLACLLNELVEWGSVINLPTYGATGPATRKVSEVIISKENRHGKILGLVSNQKRWNFGFRIFDMNVASAHDIGAYRNYLYMLDGEWSPGFDGLTFLPDAKENEAILKIAQRDNTMTFEHGISPNRWPSFYGVAYLAAKLLITRLAAEKKHLDNEVREIRTAIKVPPESYDKGEVVGEVAKKQVVSVVTEVDGLDMTGEFDAYPRSQDGLDTALTHRGKVTQYLEKLRFQTRATEWALWNKMVARYGVDAIPALCEGEISTDRIPVAGWVKGKWTSTRASNRSAGWLTLEAHGYKLRMRQTTITVSANANAE